MQKISLKRNIKLKSQNRRPDPRSFLIERISIKATVSWTDKIETGVTDRLNINVPKERTYTKSVRVTLKYPEE